MYTDLLHNSTLDMEEHHLLQPLLSPSSTASAAAPPLDDNVLETSSSNSGIIFRLSLVVFVCIVSIFANHEASKGYDIALVNDSGDTFAGRRFNLFYVSNDDATRIVIRASNIVEKILYPSASSKKPITRVIIRLADANVTEDVVVESGSNHEVVLNISPSILEGKDFGHEMNLALRQGVARMWLWSGQGTTPKAKSLIDGIVEYLVNNSVGPPQPRRSAAAEFLSHREHRQPGFVRRLNRAMKDGWDDKKLDGALGLPVQDLCTTY